MRRCVSLGVMARPQRTRTLALRALVVAAIAVPVLLEVSVPLRADGNRPATPGAAPAASAVAPGADAPTPAPSDAPTATPSPSSPGTTTPLTAAPLAFAQDALVDPVVSGRTLPGIAVRAQRLENGAWVDRGTTQAKPDGGYTLTLTAGTGELRSDRWRVVAADAASPDIAVVRTAVLNVAGHAPSRAEVQYSWRDGCPTDYRTLRVLDVNYYGFDGKMHRGQLVIQAAMQRDFEGLLQTMLDNRFPIRKMRSIEAYQGNDDASAADDNTSAFNCRRTPLGTYWSEHSHGSAIDINPLENPYHNAGDVIPPAGKPYLDRADARPGMLLPGGPVMTYALAHGWLWLAPTDYQHLER